MTIVYFENWSKERNSIVQLGKVQFLLHNVVNDRNYECANDHHGIMDSRNEVVNKEHLISAGNK